MGMFANMGWELTVGFPHPHSWSCDCYWTWTYVSGTLTLDGLVEGDFGSDTWNFFGFGWILFFWIGCELVAGWTWLGVVWMELFMVGCVGYCVLWFQFYQPLNGFVGGLLIVGASFDGVKFLDLDDSVNGAEEINGDISKQMNLDDESDIEGVSDTVFDDKVDSLGHEHTQNLSPNEKENSSEPL
ncbi:hypothetical protein Tco_0163206 [Tanacetum coccineum]